ncbi:helix-turn-helix domain-containing protein [Tunicatimonas pelagia]|uniref:helix-turn-helix domain-containing protein n=1 Tax=Tunicatimonas pelagia TaxID=931531 RepID=UPI0026650F28|nr:helix-turn-helix domain-containing protein [Tunicatimonas pelagia]WKN44290.1 helix-turn-helix domain-containing protein [Tunicatimonas pelagia]
MKYPTYQINLPAQIRLDRTLSAHARLLYGEIKALCDQQGYCWASNQYLARLYGVQKETVSVWLRQLRRGGWIEIQLDTSQGNLRKIYLTQLKNVATPSNEKSQGGVGETTRGLMNTSPPSCDSIGAKPPALLSSIIIDKNDRVDSTPLTILSVSEERESKEKKGSSDVTSEKPPPPFRSPPLPRNNDIGRENFTKPMVQEVEAYMQQQTELCPNASVAKVQASRFVNYYQSNGWKVGRHPMQDWQAAARNWLFNLQDYEKTQRSYPQKSFANPTEESSERPMDYSIPL